MYTVCGWVDILGYEIPLIYGNIISYRYILYIRARYCGIGSRIMNPQKLASQTAPKF
jgi:hypothetical protein